MFFGTTVQNGYVFWKEQVWLKCFAPSAVPGLLLGGFQPLNAGLPYLPIYGHTISVFPTLSPTAASPQRRPLTLPKDSFHCASLVTPESELWAVYVDENVDTCNTHPSHPLPNCPEWLQIQVETVESPATWYNEETKQWSDASRLFSFLWFHFRKRKMWLQMHTDSIYVGNMNSM